MDNQCTLQLTHNDQTVISEKYFAVPPFVTDTDTLPEFCPTEQTVGESTRTNVVEKNRSNDNWSRSFPAYALLESRERLMGASLFVVGKLLKSWNLTTARIVSEN
jgi:hypothetical protein